MISQLKNSKMHFVVKYYYEGVFVVIKIDFCEGDEGTFFSNCDFLFREEAEASLYNYSPSRS